MRAPEENEEVYLMKHIFRRFAAIIATTTGSPWAFMIAVLVILVWGVTGPLFHFSDTWQLVINTSTTIVTFLMVFLIQNTQNRDAVTIQLKLDELLRGVVGARTSLVDLENLSDEDIALLRKDFTRMQISAAKREKEATEATVDSLEENDPVRNSSITR
jgi:low affinity Fe/Cu permease